MPELVVSISGVRGVVGEGLTPDVMLSFARAFGAWCGGAVVLGRDSRVSGPMFHQAVTAGLLAVCSHTVRRMISRGELPGCFRVGRFIRIPASSINGWIAAHGLGQPAPIAARTPGELKRKAEAMAGAL